MKILQTADWHIGSFKGPEKDGVNLRAQDTINCLMALCDIAAEQHPDISVVSGDIFHQAEVWQGRSHKEVHAAYEAIRRLEEASKVVVVMRGTPNHDSAEAFATLQDEFIDHPKVHIITTPQIINLPEIDIALIPGFDHGYFRSQHPGLGREEENEVISKELADIVVGLRAQSRPGVPMMLMAHYTVPGANATGSQEMQLTNFEPIIPQDALLAANYDLVCLGHIHTPQKVQTIPNCFYCGSINRLNFNDEGHPRGFYIHDLGKDDIVHSEFYPLPAREFHTIELNDEDVSKVNAGLYEWWKDDKIKDAIVRVLFSCTRENEKALNRATLTSQLMDQGAFWVSEIRPDKITEWADRTNMDHATDPQTNLQKYLESKYEFTPERIQELKEKADPIIQKALASESTTSTTGIFEPIEISVKNYRNYEEATFNFKDVTFCTINGKNGAGKSSLFMDAILDCLYEEPREGDLTGWIRKGDNVRSGAISFQFSIGDHVYRVVRTRARSGKATLNLSEFVNNEWVDRSKEKFRDTQDEIIKILGMDSMTFKSCALIMQDQYGLFLEAKKEDRMAILGNLLGLGIYDDMEKIASDTARQYGAKNRDIKNEITINENAITGYGNPADRKEQIEAYTAQLTQQKEEAQKTVNSLSYQLKTLSEARERAARLKSEATTASIKADGFKTDIKKKEVDIATYDQILADSEFIHDKVKEYRSLEEQAAALRSQAEIYDSKVMDLRRAAEEVRQESTQHDAQSADLASVEDQLKKIHVDPFTWSQAQEAAKRYEAASKAVEELSAKKAEYLSALNRKSQEDGKLGQIKGRFERDKAALDSKKKSLEKRTELLRNSGCIDIENAHCRFLADAQEAKKELEGFADQEKQLEDKYVPDIIAQEEVVDNCLAAIKELDGDRINERLSKAVAEREAVKDAPARLEAIKDQYSREESLIARKEVLSKSLEQSAKRLADATERQQRAQDEVDRYKDAKRKKIDIDGKLDGLKPFLDMEKQLPVTEERKSSAQQMIAVLEKQYNEAMALMADKTKEYSDELKKSEGLDEMQAKYNEAMKAVNDLAGDINTYQLEIGSLNEKIKQIANLETRNKELRESQKKVAAETADYDLLKLCFSPDGIPHQIIRTIIPNLEETASAILGQMTSGHMGLKIRTEKTLRSNSNKEVVSMDVIIEEYGKTELPYMSKSGGEKVKAALSVALALAEIKASVAGIRLGMLFLDEPPFLDEEGTDAYVEALKAIQQRYQSIKIMAITHDEGFKARFPQSVTIFKDEHGSHVVSL